MTNFDQTKVPDFEDYRPTISYLNQNNYPIPKPEKITYVNQKGLTVRVSPDQDKLVNKAVNVYIEGIRSKKIDPSLRPETIYIKYDDVNTSDGAATGSYQESNLGTYGILTLDPESAYFPKTLNGMVSLVGHEMTHIFYKYYHQQFNPSLGTFESVVYNDLEALGYKPNALDLFLYTIKAPFVGMFESTGQYGIVGNFSFANPAHYNGDIGFTGYDFWDFTYDVGEIFSVRDFDGDGDSNGMFNSDPFNGAFSANSSFADLGWRVTELIMPDGRDYNGDGKVNGFWSPLIVDLDNDGVEFSPLDGSPVQFDVDNDGYLERTSWVGADDGLLVYDIGNDGKVDQSKEIAFAEWTSVNSDSDLEGLRATFDSNKDGVLDSNDADWSQFKIWKDANQNGKVDAGELKTLAQTGIKSFKLKAEFDKLMVFNDLSMLRGLFDVKMTNGSTTIGGDMSFVYDEYGVRETVRSDGTTSFDFEGSDNAAEFMTFNATLQNFTLSGNYFGATGNKLANKIDAKKMSTNVMLDGGEGDDTLYGGSGNDIIKGGAGLDRIDAGAGDDIVYSGGDSWYGKDSAGKGYAKVSGGAGYDLVIMDENSALSTTNMDFYGFEAVQAGNKDDKITATSDKVDHNFWGNGGNDKLTGAGGDDQLNGGVGKDELYGSGGSDFLFGGSDNDRLFGGEGDDFLFAGTGIDVVSGGSGNDVYVYSRGDGLTTIEDKASFIFDSFSLKMDSALIATEVNVLYSGGRNDDPNNIIYKDFNLSTLEGGDAGSYYGKPYATLEEIVEAAVEKNDKDVAYKSLLGGFNCKVTFEDGSSERFDTVGEFLNKYASKGKEDSVSLSKTDYDAFSLSTYASRASGHQKFVSRFKELYSKHQADKDSLSKDEALELKQLFEARISVKVDGKTEKFKGIHEFLAKYDNAKLSMDTIYFDGDIDINDISIGEVNGFLGSNMIISVDSGADNKIKDNIVVRTWGSTSNEIEGLSFSDGKYLYLADIHQFISSNAKASNKNEFITGTNKADKISAEGGNDIVLATEGDDVIYGGAGEDQLFGGAGQDILLGGAGNDRLFVGQGEAGSKVAWQGAQGGDGDDTYVLEQGFWRFAIGYADSKVVKDNGNDTISFADSKISDWTISRHPNGAKDSLIFTSKVNKDVAHLHDLKEIEKFEFSGGKRNVSKILLLDDGRVELSGGAKRDKIEGTAGEDVISGGDGNDYLYGFLGVDALYGGAGNDTLSVGARGKDADQSGWQLARGGADDDTYTIFNNAGNLSIREESAGGSGKNDTVDFRSTELAEWQVSSHVSSGKENYLQFKRIANPTDVVHIYDFDRIEKWKFDDGARYFDKISVRSDGRVELDGGKENDKIGGTAGDDVISGGAGNDYLYGYRGVDWLYGGDGNDTLSVGARGKDADQSGWQLARGGAGDDTYTIFNNAGNLSIREESAGGSGKNDTVDFRDTELAEWQVSSITNPSNGEKYLQFKRTEVPTDVVHIYDFDRIEKWKFDDGARYFDKISFSSDGRVELVGGKENDKIGGSAGDDVISGGAGNDYLYGYRGVDWLYGGDGNDTLSVGARGKDADQLSWQLARGGAGDDTYTIFNNAGNLSIREESAGGSGKYDTLDFRDTELAEWQVSSHVNNDKEKYLQFKRTDVPTDVLHIYDFDRIEKWKFDDGARYFDKISVRSDGRVELVGGKENDKIAGTVGDDVIYGGAGDDQLFGGAGQDILIGGAGNDRLFVGQGEASTKVAWQGAQGGDGDDTYVLEQGFWRFAIGYADSKVVKDNGNDTISFANSKISDWTISRHPNGASDSLIFSSKINRDVAHLHDLKEIEMFEFGSETYSTNDIFALT